MTAEDRKEIIDLIDLSIDEFDKKLDLKFKKIEDCQVAQDNINRKINNDYARFCVIETKVNLILAVISAVGVAVLGLVINQIWR